MTDYTRKLMKLLSDITIMMGNEDNYKWKISINWYSGRSPMFEVIISYAILGRGKDEFVSWDKFSSYEEAESFLIETLKSSIDYMTKEAKEVIESPEFRTVADIKSAEAILEAVKESSV